MIKKLENLSDAIASNSEESFHSWITQLKDDNKRLRSENEEIRQLLAKAEEFTQKNAQLFPMLVHESIAPLNIISFATSLLKRRGDRWSQEKKQQHLDRIQAAVNQLSQLMDETLLIGKLDSKKLACQPTKLDLALFCSELIEQLKLSDRNEHRIEAIVQGDCSNIYLDRKWLQPILTNLLTNSLKYSPVGSTIDLTILRHQEKVIFKIQDRGIGISQKELQHLFEPFYRGENVGKISGSGLGLTIVKKFVDLHNGQIEVESKVGFGTTFIFWLPIQGSALLG